MILPILPRPAICVLSLRESSHPPRSNPRSVHSGIGFNAARMGWMVRLSGVDGDDLMGDRANRCPRFHPLIPFMPLRD